MSITKMSLITIRGGIEKLDDVLYKCAGSGIFHFEQASALAEYTSSASAQKSENPYSALLSDIISLSYNTGLELGYCDFSDNNQPIEEIKQYVDKLKEHLDKLLEVKRSIINDIASLEQTAMHLKHIRALNANFDDLFSSRYLKIRFGKLPLDSVPKLDYYDEKPFIYFSFDKDKHYDWCVYFTSAKESDEIDAIFSSLYFERMRLPEYTHGTPEDAQKYIEKQLEDKNKELDIVNKKLNSLFMGEGQRYVKAYCKIKFLKESYDCRKYAAVHDDIFTIVGFVPQKQSESFIKSLCGCNRVAKVLRDSGKQKSVTFIKDGEEIEDYISPEEEKQFYSLLESCKPIEITAKPPEKDNRIPAPVLLKNSFFAKPFEMFVSMFGLPSYNSLDPTAYVAITYTLLFGIMFGDLGQGLLISLIGWLLAKYKKMPLGNIMSRIGISSAFFGLMYGSVFGFEEALDPIYKSLFGLPSKPINVLEPATTNYILISAVGLGAFIIISSIVINIYLGIKNRDIGRAVFSSNGISGIVFYVSVLALIAASLAQTSAKPVGAAFIILFIAVPLVVIFLKEPLCSVIAKKPAFDEGFGSFFAESFFEMFEVLLSYISNTMSFLRVGGFILSHAGMMAVVFELSKTIRPGASLFVIIFGNMLVMAVEGLIVGIQVLRLEFYEIFSRFYDGDGKAYKPVIIDYYNN